MGRLRLGGEQLHLDLLQARGGQPRMEIRLAEAEPVIAVELARLVEMMLVEIEDDEPAALAQKPRGGGERLPADWPCDAAPG